MDGILFVNVAVLGRERKMITKEQLQFLKENNIPYIHREWENYEKHYNDGTVFKRYLNCMKMAAYRKWTWEDSIGLEELNYG